VLFPSAVQIPLPRNRQKNSCRHSSASRLDNGQWNAGFNCKYFSALKLLRSTADGQVFDPIPIVAGRYLSRRGWKDLEVWKPARRLRAMSADEVLTERQRWESRDYEVEVRA
jgi:hypothetical protein